MKNILLTLCVFCFINIEAQEIVNINLWNQLPNDTGKYFADLDNNFDNFVGIWEYQNGNQTFQVTLWKEDQVPYYSAESPQFYADQIQGHYKMILNKDLPTEDILYQSEKKMGLSTTDWAYALFGRTIDGIIFGGRIFDTAGSLNVRYQTGVRGHLLMTINQGTAPQTAIWKIILPQGMYGDDEPQTFTIPTDIILTKIN